MGFRYLIMSDLIGGTILIPEPAGGANTYFILQEGCLLSCKKVPQKGMVR